VGIVSPYFTVIEMHCDGHVEIVGFGFASFVKKDFADAEVLNSKLGLNCRIIESVACGRSVIATYDEVRNANTRGELQQVILDTSWKNNRLNPAQRDEVRVLLGRAYQELFSGYGFASNEVGIATGMLCAAGRLGTEDARGCLRVFQD
jgi:hypothetical protein